jgi:hypothetical protein
VILLFQANELIIDKIYNMKNIYVLPTDKPSRFFITNEDEYGFREHYAPDTMQTIKCMNIHITSDDEIKEGVEQWYLDKFLNKPMNSGGAQYGERQNVIILTTDQDLIKDGVQPIDDDFLEWFVNNPSCESVEVDRDEREVGNHLGGVVIEYGDYKIITPQEEPKDVVLGYKTSIVAQMLDSKEELKQKSPVEWLESRITVLIPDDIGSQLMFKNNIKKAKEMEENQQKLLSASWAKSREQTREVSMHIGFASGFMNGLECYEDYYSELDKTELDEDEFTRNYIVDIFEQTYKKGK